MTGVEIEHLIRNLVSFVAEYLIIIYYFHGIEDSEKQRKYLGFIFLFFMIVLYRDIYEQPLINNGTIIGFGVQLGRTAIHALVIYLYLHFTKELNQSNAVYWSLFLTGVYVSTMGIRAGLLSIVTIYSLPEIYRSVVSYISIGIEIATALIVFHSVKIKELSDIGKGRWFQGFLVTFLQLFIKWSLIDSDSIVGHGRIDGVFFSLIAIFGEAFSLVIYENNQQMRSKQIQIEAEKVSLSYEINNAKRVIQSSTDMRKIYHDMKNHLIAIKSMSGNSNELDNYVANLLPKFADYGTQVVSGNKLIDAFLSEKVQMASLDDIHINLQLDLSELSFIESTDMITIFGNALDNAIEAVRKIPDKSERYIYIKSRRVQDMISLRFENSFYGSVQEKNAILLTKKNNKEMHGIGIKNIEKTVRKYSGSMDIKIDEEDNWFCLSLLIPLA